MARDFVEDLIYDMMESSNNSPPKITRRYPQVPGRVQHSSQNNYPQQQSPFSRPVVHRDLQQNNNNALLSNQNGRPKSVDCSSFFQESADSVDTGTAAHAIYFTFLIILFQRFNSMRCLVLF